jgi:hypothetical protein
VKAQDVDMGAPVEGAPIPESPASVKAQDVDMGAPVEGAPSHSEQTSPPY